jgi:hypothetical protein
LPTNLADFDRTVNVRYWPIADMPLAATNVGFGGKADITVDGPECPLMTQSGHWVPLSECGPKPIRCAVCGLGGAYEAA